MQRHQVFALVLGIAAFNGIFSPFVFLVAAYSVVWAPPWMPESPEILFYLSSLIVATTTLLLSGVPAALVERALPQSRGLAGPVWIWAGTALVLTFPGLVRALLKSGVVQ